MSSQNFPYFSKIIENTHFNWLKAVSIHFERIRVLKLKASTKTRSTTRCSGDLMGDQMAPGRPDRSRWPDRSWATRLLTKLAMSCCLLGKYQGLLNKSELKQASLDDQIAPGDQIGRPDFHILVMSKIWSPIWSPGAIWSAIRSLERLVVDLVVVDAVTFSTYLLILPNR